MLVRSRDSLPTLVFLGFPCGSAGKESACNVGDLGSIPGSGRSNCNQPVLCCAVLSRSVVSDSVIPWIAVHQAPLFMGILQVRILEWVAIPS